MHTLIRMFFVLFALSLVGSAEQASAFAFNGRDQAFCENGLRSPQELAGKIDRSIAADPTGNRRLQDCLATPNDFLQGFRLADPKAAATQLAALRDLSVYVRSLVVMTPADTDFRTSCLQITAAGKHQVKMDCVERPIRNGEVIYGNPKTKVLVLMSSCANPGAVPAIVVDAKCIEVHSPSMDMKANVRFAYIAPNSLSSKCHALLLAGETQKRAYTSECPDRYPVIRDGLQVWVNCVWDAVEDAVSKKLGVPSKVQNASGSYKPRALGTNVWYLPLDARTGEAVICWDLPDGRVATIGVRREHYVTTDDGRMVATITPAHVNAAYTEQW